MLRITYPENGASVAVLTDEQKEYMEMDRSSFVRETFDWLNLKRESDKENPHPRPVILKWEPAVMGLAQISETEDIAPRFIYVDGISNMRDAGGWRTKDGRRIRQRMVFRGSEMNSHVTISPKGIETILNDLKIRTDLALCAPKENRLDVLLANYR